MEYLTELLKILGIALVCAILSTNTINGVKKALNVSKEWINRVIAFAIDLLMSFWFYFSIAGQTDILTYVICLVLTYAGAETIYNIMGSLSEAKTSYNDFMTKIVGTEASSQKKDDSGDGYVG